MKMLANRAGLALPVAALALLAACGGEPAPVAPPAPTAAPAVAPTPSAEPTAAETAAAAPTAAPSGSASAAPAPKPSSGRPMVMKQDATEITDTFGSSPGAKLEIGDKEIAVFKIPEGALHVGTNITFKLDSKGKSGGGQVGKIYHVTPFIPPAQQPSTVASDGPPFELQMPAGNKKDANLAIGVIDVDAQGREKIKWQVIAPKRIDDATGTAYFELPTLNDAYLHVTTKAPTGDKK